ncbi:MAG: BREX system P-loop protein BrxC, partial [Thermomicrobiales bacterium]|nr:BREX system P-loop protein BrxC [Thermomicrobiales bacterium]
WVSGFFGSGKSHFTRVLAALWTDLELPDGTRARGLVHGLSDDIKGHLVELNASGARSGGLWAASGTLSSGARSFRLAVLGILLEAANLPSEYGPGTFMLWLRKKGYEPAVRETLAAEGLSLDQEVVHLYVSTDLAAALLVAQPDLAATPAEVLRQLKEQFAAKADIDDAELVRLARQILASVSTDAQPDWSKRKLPATLLVLDELQQYIGDYSDRSLEVQTTVERLQSDFDGQVMVVATGQAALQSTPNLQKLIARFRIHVQLRSNDVDEVVRKVILEKAPAHVPALRALLEEQSGEIDRHLQGTNIGARAEDHATLVADYPLLPTRRRFWEAVLRAVDQTGAGGQLRSQLQLTHEATAKIADRPLGWVIPGDAIFDRLRDTMLNSGALLNETDAIIHAQREAGGTNGELRSRVLALVFLINQLPSGGMGDTGLQATASTIADLLVEDLTHGSSRLREEITQVLGDLAGDGLLMAVDGQYRLQTREGQEWESDFRARQARIRNDDARVTSDRAEELKKALTSLKSLSVLQGTSKEKRQSALHFGTEPPPAGEGIPIWVRDQWAVTEKTVREDAQRDGMDSAVIHVFLPSRNAEELRAALAAYGAAQETLATRPVASTPAGIEARASMEGRVRQERTRLDGLLAEIQKHAVVYQGGGVVVVEPSLQEALQRAMEASASRLFHRFADADQRGWDKVVDRATQGNASPLDAIGHTGEPMNHPVPRAIADFLKTPRTGLQLRKHFGAPPFGWPQDAIDGGVLALIVDLKVRATINGKPRLIAELKRTQVGQTEFVLEDSPATVPDRLRLRSLASALLGAKEGTGDDAHLAERVLSKLAETAQKAGGPAPLPAVPAPELLAELRLTQGVRRIIEIAANSITLRAWYDEWSALAQKIPSREDRWARLQRLLRVAEDLPEYDDIAAHVAAIRDNRLLLQDPDPTEAPIDRLVEGLRTSLRAAHDALASAQKREVQALEATPEWGQLTDLQWRKILAENNLEPVPEVAVGDDQAILRELEKRPLATWADRTAALPGRAAAAHQAAVKLLEPEAGKVQPKPATLKDEAEVNTYLTALRAEIMALIQSGRPVVITR